MQRSALTSRRNKGSKTGKDEKIEPGEVRRPLYDFGPLYPGWAF